MISNSSICDVEREGCKKHNNKKDSGVKRKGCKKDNSKNVYINNDKDKDKDNDKDKDKDNLISKLLNNLTNIAKLKEKMLINKKKVEK